MNLKESCCLQNGFLLSKETLMEAESIDSLEHDENISVDSISLNKVRFQAQGSTVLHYFALDAGKLKIILDYMEKHHPDYMMAILIKNDFGKSPMDIAIENEASRSVELFLRKLKYFESLSLSSLFYDRFPELFDLQLQSFNEYLESCFFQTLQMKSIKHLDLKNRYKKEEVYLTHSNCIIDEDFMQKYCYWEKKKKKKRKNKTKKKEEKKEST